jgi:cytochrome c oxidase cbb3-type subunit III
VNPRGSSVRRPNAGWRGHWTVLTLVAGLGAGCDLPGRPKISDRYVPPPTERTFSALFQRNCAGCHGADGKLGPAPPLNDKLYLALVPDKELKRVIAEGRPGTLMPAFGPAKGGHLTPEQVDILAEGIKPRWGPVGPAPSDAPSYFLATATPDSAVAGHKEEGLKVFARACASCHGDDGEGGTSDGKSVGAINDPDFLALVSDQALRRYVIAGRPDLGMPDYADPTGRPEGFRPLLHQDVTNVVALLADWRQSGSVQEKGN